MTFGSVSLSCLTVNTIIHSLLGIISLDQSLLTLVHLFLSHFLSICIYVYSLLLSLFHSVFPILFLSCAVSSCYCSTPLQESQRMQTKLDALTREVFDLQETINWKDKKIGVGGLMQVLWQSLRGKRWLCFSIFQQLLCLSYCLCMMETLRQ